VVALRHTTLRDKSGAQTNQIRSAVSLLANEGLIHVIAESVGDEAHRVQKYQIVGRLEAPRNWSATLGDSVSKLIG
jgi:hypothetical protein